MREYEVMVIFDPDIEERSVQPTLEQYLKVITKGGGTVDNLDIWGRRRLAYEIRKKSEGIYAVINLTAEPGDVKELDRQFTINESIMRRSSDPICTCELRTRALLASDDDGGGFNARCASRARKGARLSTDRSRARSVSVGWQAEGAQPQWLDIAGSRLSDNHRSITLITTETFMAGETTITLVGNLTADPELRFTLGCGGCELHRRVHHARSIVRPTNGGTAMRCSSTARCGARLLRTWPNHCKRECGSSCRGGFGRAATRPETASGARFSRSTWTRSDRRCVTPRRRSRGM